MAHVLHYNRVKILEDSSFFSIVLWTKMAAVTSDENHLNVTLAEKLSIYQSMSFVLAHDVSL